MAELLLCRPILFPRRMAPDPNLSESYQGDLSSSTRATCNLPHRHAAPDPGRVGLLTDRNPDSSRTRRRIARPRSCGKWLREPIPSPPSESAMKLHPAPRPG